MEHAVPPVTTRQVSVVEAARELGISPETVRRRIKAGQIEARRTIRPQGTVWEVDLPVTTSHGVPPVIAVTGSGEASRSEPAHASPDEAWHPSPPLAGHADHTAPLVASIARLVAELAEVRVISDRRADQLVAQAETIGQLRADLAAAESRLLALAAPQQSVEAPGATQGTEPSTELPVTRARPWWRWW
jgi:hypothetical protein